MRERRKHIQQYCVGRSNSYSWNRISISDRLRFSFSPGAETTAHRHVVNNNVIWNNEIKRLRDRFIGLKKHNKKVWLLAWFFCFGLREFNFSFNFRSCVSKMSTFGGKLLLKVTLYTLLPKCHFISLDSLLSAVTHFREIPHDTQRSNSSNESETHKGIN